MKKRAFILIVIAGIAWGTSGIFVHMLSPFGFSSIQMTFFRAAVAAVSFIIYGMIKDKNIFKVNLEEIILYAFIGFSFYGTASCYYSSMQATSISTAVVLMYLAPIYVMVYSVIFFKEKLTVIKVILLATMLVGCALVSGVIGGIEFDLIGVFLGILAGIAYAAYNIFTKIAMQKGCNPKTTTLYCFLFASLFSLCSSNPSQIPVFIIKDVLVTLPLIFGLGITTCVLPYFLYTLALKELDAGTASALSIVEPMSATVFSVIIFHEELKLLPLIGIILIIGATLLLSRNDALSGGIE